jgi:hypothetical protein
MYFWVSGFIYMVVTGFLLYNTIRCISGSGDSFLYNTDPMHFRISGFFYDFQWIYLLWLYKCWPDALSGQWIHILWLSVDSYSMVINWFILYNIEPMHFRRIHLQYFIFNNVIFKRLHLHSRKSSVDSYYMIVDGFILNSFTLYGYWVILYNAGLTRVLLREVENEQKLS